ncbi:MAG: DNRLRE domain-containing protein [bacterium]|nr:DNRLRE domain-containing protein [bacterium]
MKLRPLSASVLLLVPALVTPAPADVVVLVADRDNTLFEHAQGATSNGVGQFLFAGKNSMGSRRRAVAHFPLEQVPTGSTIESVVVSFYLVSSSSGNEVFRLHRLTHDWGEGASNSGMSGNGAPAQPTDATWLDGLTPGCPWASAGGDFSSTSTGGAVMGDVAGLITFASGGLVDDVQAWVDGTEPNYGWILKHGDENAVQTAKRIASREYATSAWRPALTIIYSPGPDCGGIAYCGPGVPSSTGCPATTTFSGSCAVADNLFTLEVSGVPSGQFGYFLASRTQGEFMPAGSSGVICLVGQIARYNEGTQVIQGPTGSVRINLDAIPTCIPVGCQSEAVLPGDTWSFQCWYRDVGPSNNFTNGLQVTFE